MLVRASSDDDTVDRGGRATRRGRSLRWLLTALCLTLVVPVLLFAGVLLRQFAVSERARVELEALALSRGLATMLDREVNGVLTTVQALATSPSLQSRDLAAFYAQAGEINRLQGVHLSLRDLEGRTLLTTRAPLGASVETVPALLDADREVLRTGTPFVTNVFKGAVSGLPAFQIVSAPVAVGGVRTYLLSASLNLDYLAGALRKGRLPAGWTGVLVDRAGTFAARTERHEDFAGKGTSADFRAQAVGDEGSYYGRNTAGREVLAGYARSALTGWTASANVEAEAVAEPLRRSLLTLAGLGLVLGLAAAGAGLAVAGRIDRAVGRLGKAAAAIGRGAVPEAPATSVAEVDRVGRVLVSSAQRLRELNETLEARVAQRTRERDRVWLNSQDLQAVLGTDGVFRAVNPAATAILGWEAGEMVGRSVFDFVVPEDAGATAGALAQASLDALPTFENRYRHRDGGCRSISWVAAPEGDLIFASGRDVTAQREQAEALGRAEEALRQAQKMEAVGQLTGGIAHDFNNLLAGIVGSLDMMRTRIAQGRIDVVGRYVETAMGSAQRAAALTHRLLAFSRRQPLDPRPVDANALVAGMEDLLRRTIGPQHALEIVAAGDLWTTLCDANQLENALLNLAINARDAMPDGGRLVVETRNARLDGASAAGERGVAPGEYVRISVVDTGTGMTPDVSNRALEPFFTTKPLGQGTGLGLSMAYGFARQSGGHLGIKSEPGRGTSVRIHLPRHRGTVDDADDDIGGVAEVPRAEAGQTVLVVEDEPVVRDLVVEVLGDLGYRVLQAADGPAGLKVLQSRKRIDLVVSDVGLPGLNGRQMVDHARERRRGLKALFITGYAENATLAAGFLEPGMEMMTKPFAVDALAARVAAMLRG